MDICNRAFKAITVPATTVVFAVLGGCTNADSMVRPFEGTVCEVMDDDGNQRIDEREARDYYGDFNDLMPAHELDSLIRAAGCDDYFESGGNNGITGGVVIDNDGPGTIVCYLSTDCTDAARRCSDDECEVRANCGETLYGTNSNMCGMSFDMDTVQPTCIHSPGCGQGVQTCAAGMCTTESSCDDGLIGHHPRDFGCR